MKLQSKQQLGIVLLLSVAIIWGSGFIASQIALDADVSPELLMMVRFVVATIVIGIGSFKTLKKHIKKTDLKPSITVGIFLFLAFYIQIIALQYTTPANNAFLTATNVVMVPFLWWIFSKKAPPLHIFIASAICLLGMAILSFQFGQAISFAVGDLLTLLCALFFAFHIVVTGMVIKKTHPTVLVFLQFCTAAVLSIVVFLFTDRDFSPMMTLDGLGSLLYLGIFSTCVCYFLQTTAQKHVSSSKAAIILGTEALFGSLFSVLLGYDDLTTQMVIGGSIMMIALLLTEVRFKRKEPDNTVVER